MSKPTYAQQAADLNLWREYVDPQRAVSDEDFHAMSLADREARIVETFGPEIVIPTVDDVLSHTRVERFDLHSWPAKDGIGDIHVSYEELRPALEEAYDPANPHWSALVMIEGGL